MSEMQGPLSDIWADDYLGRKDDAIYLSKYLEDRYQARKKEAGFVLAVNGEWGMGKTFLLERWSKDMRTAGHPVINFNSWENDFTPEPLVAFIAELDEALEPLFTRIPKLKKYKTAWFKQAKAVLVPCVKVVGLAIAKHGAGLSADGIAELFKTDENSESARDKGEDGDKEKVDSDDADADDERKLDTKELGEKLSKAIDDTLQAHTNTKQAISAFKSRLALMIEHMDTISDVQLPVCVFIDELDRCRPDYAIRLLEGIKHLFGVPGLHFVVATNLTELSHSVRAVYGAGFGADQYLKRFFDLEYSLPLPGGEKYANELMAPLADLCDGVIITGFDQLFTMPMFAKGLPFIFRHYATEHSLSLRDQQQAAKLLDAALITLRGKPVHIHFLIFLACLYQKDSQIYQKVAIAKHLGANTGYPEKFPGTGIGGFRIPDFDSDDGELKYVPVSEVAKVYFDHINNPELRPRAINGSDFPANLHQKIVQGTESKAPIIRYIEIIRQAGRFTK